MLTAKEHRRMSGERETFYILIRVVISEGTHLPILIKLYIFKWIHFIGCKSYFRKVDLKTKEKKTIFVRCYHGSNQVKGRKKPLWIILYNCI